MGLEPRPGSYTEPFSFFTGTDLPLIYHVACILEPTLPHGISIASFTHRYSEATKNTMEYFLLRTQKIQLHQQCPHWQTIDSYESYEYICVSESKPYSRHNKVCFLELMINVGYFLENQNHRKQCSTSDSYSYEIFFVNETHTASSCVMLHW